MKKIVVLTTFVLSACSTMSPTQKQPVAGVGSVDVGLSDLTALTFRCPQAGLNAAAREAAGTPSQGSYQFSYFKLISGSHHSLYEVHFKSNYREEADLKYCVSVYCQQGQEPDPKVSLVSNEAEADAGGAARSAVCGN